MDGTDKETRSDSSRADGIGADEPPVGAGSRVGRVLSRIASAPTADPGPPPDGGYDAWMAGKRWAPVSFSCVVCSNK